MLLELAPFALAAILLLIAALLSVLSKRPKPKCVKCGQDVGSNDHCDWCVDDRAAP